MDLPAVLFLPIVDWDFRRQRPQQLARCFARAGHRVYYPDLRLAAELRPPRLVESGIWRLALAGDPDLDPYRDRLAPEAADRAVAGLAAAAADHPLAGCWIVAQLPFWRPLAEAARDALGGRILFDCMDDFSSFGDHGDLGDEEEALARTADLVVVTARRLFDKHAPHNRRTVIVGNGCDPEHFGPAAARPVPSGRPVVGFFGGIHDWFDGPLVEALARLRPDWEVWLVGDTYRGEVEGLRTLPNVTFFGEMPYSELPRLASYFDVGIIPFRVNPLTEATDPVKVYEMLAAGLPVVAVDLPELRRLSPHVALARTPEEFAARIEEALAEPPEARRQRRELAAGHSWVERFLTLHRAMDEVDSTVTPQAGRVRPTRESLGVVLEDAERRAARLESELAAATERAAEAAGIAAERLSLLAAERLSLLEQRDRVQAEVDRLARELARVENERVALERELGRITGSRWWRLASLYWRLRSRRSRRSP